MNPLNLWTTGKDFPEPLWGFVDGDTVRVIRADGTLWTLMGQTGTRMDGTISIKNIGHMEFGNGGLFLAYEDACLAKLKELRERLESDLKDAAKTLQRIRELVKQRI